MILTREALEGLLDEIGIKVMSETSETLIAYCPFHLNRETPALNVAIEYPHGFRCWNPTCDLRGSLVELVKRALEVDLLEATRVVTKYKENKNLPAWVASRVSSEKPQRKNNSVTEETLLNCKVDFDNPIDLKSLLDRGFTIDTLREFEIGFSKFKNRIVIPIRGADNQLLGFSGRAVDSWQRPKYRESKYFEKKKIWFNVNRAIHYDTIIVVEGPLDAMKVYQAGFPNVVATLGGSLSDNNARWLQSHAETVIIFTDNDQEGRRLGQKIENAVSNKKVFWAIYPDGYKDPGSLNEKEIKQAIENRKTRLQIKLDELKIRVSGGKTNG